MTYNPLFLATLKKVEQNIVSDKSYSFTPLGRRLECLNVYKMVCVGIRIYYFLLSYMVTKKII
jgi:hypothetical protein